MHVLVTGGTGFIGTHVVRELVSRQHRVTMTTSRLKDCGITPPAGVEVCEYRLGEEAEFFASIKDQFDSAVHLAWHGVPDYKSIEHNERNVEPSYRLIRGLVDAGVERVLVTGTCLEYGAQEDCLHEDMTTAPTTSYGIAKDSLRKLLQQLQGEVAFELIWARLFYMYGSGQSPTSLIPDLEQAITRGDKVFRMSPGDQLRDFLPVTQVASLLVDLLEAKAAGGVVNCCSGEPTSVISLVKKFVSDAGADIELLRGVYGYPDFEPRNFWGSTERMNNLLSRKPHG